MSSSGPVAASRRSSLSAAPKLQKPLPEAHMQPSGALNGCVGDVTASGVASEVPKNRTATHKITRNERNEQKEHETKQYRTKTREQCVDALKGYRSSGDVDGLALVARERGVPDDLRRTVWPILLKHHPCAATKPPKKDLPGEGVDIPHDRIPRDIKRYRRRLRKEPSTGNQTPPSKPSPEDHGGVQTVPTVPDQAALDDLAYENTVRDAIVSFLKHHPDICYNSHMSYVCLSLGEMLAMDTRQSGMNNDDQSKEPDATLTTCFERLMCVMLWCPQKSCEQEEQLDDEITMQRISQFLTAFRKLSPELAGYLQQEDAVGLAEDWLWGWIKWWCAKELGKAEKGRLWDWYLGCQPSTHAETSASNPQSPAELPESFYPCDWHMFTCCALLKSRKDKLEELEQSEIRSILLSLPPVDMNLIIEEAKSLRQKLVERNCLEEEELANTSGKPDP